MHIKSLRPNTKLQNQKRYVHTQIIIGEITL